MSAQSLEVVEIWPYYWESGAIGTRCLYDTVEKVLVHDEDGEPSVKEQRTRSCASFPMLMSEGMLEGRILSLRRRIERDV